MTTTKHLNVITPRPKLRLSEIERQIRLHRIITPVPSRRALVAMCDEGTLETAPRSHGQPYLVYEDSFLAWVKELDKS